VSEQIPEKEVFANTYHYFIRALKVLAADADAQCKAMGNYNVACEIKDDVIRGAPLLGLSEAQGLTSRERSGIRDLVTALEEIPASLLVSTTSEAESRKAMSHPSWIPLRVRASELLSLLAATRARNEAYLSGRSSLSSSV
jgi:hypothetical protein